MDNLYNAVLICEGSVEPDDEDHYFACWQMLIDNGYVWQLQGWFGRMAMDFIEEGKCVIR